MIPSLDFGGTGREITFLHANGYPPGCYRLFLERLAERYQVRAMLQRPLWVGSEPQEIEDWAPFSLDLVRYLQENGAAPSLVVGHSLGAIVALRAALQQPAYFDAVILIEPVLFLPAGIQAWQKMRASGQTDRHPIIIQVRNRRQTFDDLQRVFSAYRTRENFRYFTDQALRIHIESITCPGQDGEYRLRYSTAWEERIYYTGIWRDLDIWQDLPRLDVPTLIIRGEESDTFLQSQARKAKKTQPLLCIKTVKKSTHLLPMEKPEEVAEIIFNFLSDLRS